MEHCCRYWRLLGWLRNFLSFMECEGFFFRCSQGLASDPVRSFLESCTVLFCYNNCTINTYRSTQTYSKFPTSFYLFRPLSGTYSKKKSTVDSRSRAVWGVGLQSLAGIAGSNPADGMCFYSFECGVLSGRGLRRFDHSSIGVLPSVVCLSVNEEPHRWGLSTLVLSVHEKNTYPNIHIYRVIQNNCRGFNNLLYTVHLR